MKRPSQSQKIIIIVFFIFCGSCERQTTNPTYINYIKPSGDYQSCDIDCSYQGPSTCDLAYSADFLLHVQFVKRQGTFGGCEGPYAASYDLYDFAIIDRIWGDFYEKEIHVVAMSAFFPDPFQEGWEGLVSVKKFDDDYFLIVQQPIETSSHDFGDNQNLPSSINELKTEMDRIFNSFQILCTEEQYQSPLPKELFYDSTYYQGDDCE